MRRTSAVLRYFCNLSSRWPSFTIISIARTRRGCLWRGIAFRSVEALKAFFRTRGTSGAIKWWTMYKLFLMMRGEKYRVVNYSRRAARMWRAARDRRREKTTESTVRMGEQSRAVEGSCVSAVVGGRKRTGVSRVQPWHGPGNQWDLQHRRKLGQPSRATAHVHNVVLYARMYGTVEQQSMVRSYRETSSPSSAVEFVFSD